MRNFKFFRGYENPQIVRANWTPEIANDLMVYHNVDLESEMTNLLSEEISRQIDNDILTRLLYDINNNNNI